jgi:hypothetical protein
MGVFPCGLDRRSHKIEHRIRFGLGVVANAEIALFSLATRQASNRSSPPRRGQDYPNPARAAYATKAPNSPGFVDLRRAVA